MDFVEIRLRTRLFLEIVAGMNCVEFLVDGSCEASAFLDKKDGLFENRGGERDELCGNPSEEKTFSEILFGRRVLTRWLGRRE